jgi:hypothetical protein
VEIHAALFGVFRKISFETPASEQAVNAKQADESFLSALLTGGASVSIPLLFPLPKPAEPCTPVQRERKNAAWGDRLCCASERPEHIAGMV